MNSNYLNEALEEQNELTAVEKFSIAHDFKQLSSVQLLYKELIPKNTPGPGQQYAFEVNLDQCSGCKACITACHNENGLEEDETWRSVGLIHGGTSQTPVIQHITTACHHCLNPACLNGCPVKAYEKDTATGIVKHLEDQCIGCQYCTFTCAYDVPKYSKKKGIVHKCDMCISRLNVGEAPACVRACPTQAIRITLVDVMTVRKNPQEFVNVPETPDSSYTLPTTRYLRKQEFPPNMESSESYTVRPEHSHFPLMIMLVLTQLSVGAFLMGIFLRYVFAEIIRTEMISCLALMALAVGWLALSVSVLHLGRPLYAFRALLGLKTSWLSREIVVFGLFAFFATGYAFLLLLNPLGNRLDLRPGSASSYLQNILAVLTAGTGLLGVFCSVKVYQVTRRPLWDSPVTTVKFFLTTMITGISSTFMTTILFSLWKDIEISSLMETFGKESCLILTALSIVKMILESTIFLHLREKEWTPFKKTAFLMKETFPFQTCGRFAFGVLGGIILPLYLREIYDSVPLSVIGWLAFFICFLSLGAEFLERYLFFRTVVPLKMPGTRM